MSVSYSSRNTPRSSASQGRIKTENTALSAILRERSNGNLAPAQRTASVHSPALDVVSSNVDVVNVSNPKTNQENQGLQYVIASKSSESLNTATNQEHTLIHDQNYSKSPVESVKSVDNSESKKTEFVEADAPELNTEKRANSPHSNAYAYKSLKSQKHSERSRSEIANQNSDYTGEGFESGQLPEHGESLTKSFTKDEVIVSGNTNHNSHVNSRQNSQIKTTGGERDNTVNHSGISVAQKHSDKQFAHENSDKQSARQSSFRENTSHKSQNSRVDSQRARDHSLLSQQQTHLSLSSHYERVSRDRTPLRVNTQDQLVPPLDLSGVNLPEPVNLSSPEPPATQHVVKDQKLHASDPKSSLVHFSSREYNPSTRRTYEVASPRLSSQIPHVKSSDNFRQLDDEQDTYRDRQQEPEGIEPHRSDLADDLKVPYPFDTQALQGENTARDSKPPSPPVQTTPPPAKEPATSLRSNSNVYAVANPEVLRAQSNSHSAHSVKFNSNSQRPTSISNRTYGGSPVRDRVPTPYAKSPEQDLPKTPPDWENGKGGKSREQSNISKRSLPPQHPPLDTLHSKPGSRGTKRTQDDNQSIKRVYVESPSFTKEEEEEYRFVSSRLEDNEDNRETFREMDNSRRGYGGDDNLGNSYSENRGRPKESNSRSNSYKDNRSRKTGSDYRSYDKDRYEDRNEDRYDKRSLGRNEEEPYRDRYDDRQERNGYGDDRNSRDRPDRYTERVRENDRYDRGDRYERLRDERAEYEREPRREDEMDYRQGYRKQTTEMDERDLRKEAEYQKDLKRRIEKTSVKMKGDEKERYERERYEKEKYEREMYERERERLDRESYDKENEFPRDSLEYPPDDREGGFVQDSLDYNYGQRQQEWENPPQNPYQDSPGYFPDGFSKQDSKPDFYDPDDVERMDIVNPKAPKVDYVEQNKYDYGKNPRKTYRNIVHKKKEEEEKLDHIFITPKVPTKHKKKPKKAQSAQPEHMGYQASDSFPLGYKPSSAEEMWAQRARILSEKKGSAQSGKPAKSSASKSVPRWNSNPHVKQANKFEAPAPLPNQGQYFKQAGAYNPGNMQEQGGYSQQHSGYGTPTRQLQPLENRPAAPASTEMVPTAINPSSPFRRHMELKPISQEITTEDGQRISVDINLRLISPPPGQSGQASPQQTQQLALVPVQETQGQYATGVPYQMQDNFGNYNDGYNQGYQEVSHIFLKSFVLL